MAALSAFNPDWHEDAACRGMDSAVFFLDKGRSSSLARLTCSGCHVRQACLTWALDHRPTHGIWGGYTEKELRVLRKRRAA